MLKWIAGIFCLASIASGMTIHFEPLTASVDGGPYYVVPPGAYSPVTFITSPGAGLYVFAEASYWQTPAPAASEPNVVCAAFPTNPKSCLAVLTIDFGGAVNAVSIWTGAWTQFNTYLTIDVFAGGLSPVSTFSVVSPQQANNKMLIDISALSGVSNITAIRLSNPAGSEDSFGVVLDRLDFTPVGAPPPPPPPSVPEPQSVVLTLSGIAGVLAYRRRRA